MMGAGRVLEFINRRWLPQLAESAVGQRILRSDLWWDLSGLSLTTAILTTRGHADVNRALRESQRLVEELRPWLPPNATVLEFGCGAGLNSLAVASVCREAVGLDSSRGLIRLARRLARGRGNVGFLWYEGVNLPFQDSRFDFVFTVGVFERIPKDRVAVYVREFHRLLRDGGVAFIYFLSDRVRNSEFTRRLGNASYFYFSDEEAQATVRASGFMTRGRMTTPTATILVVEKAPRSATSRDPP